MSITSALIAVSILAGGNSLDTGKEAQANRLLEPTGKAPIVQVACSFAQFLKNPTDCENDGSKSIARSRYRDHDDDDDDGYSRSDRDRSERAGNSGSRGDRDGDSDGDGDGDGHDS